MEHQRIEAPPNVYQCIAAVQAEIAKIGISKDRKNQQQNYAFRGIDDVYNVLAPLLAKHGLCVLPRMISRQREERTTIKEWNGQRKESVLFYVTVEAEFDFIAAADGSCHTVRTFGEAMDSADKATNKAMSAAYKYAAFMTFAIPTEGDNDADSSTHAVEPKRNEPRKGAQKGMPDAEFAKLANLLKATDTSASVLLKHYKVENLRLLNQQQYGEAIERLTGRLAEMAKAESNQAAEASDEITEDDVPF